VQRLVSLHSCMVMVGSEPCPNEANWRVLSRKHCFKLMVCEQHGKAFLGISGFDVELQANDKAERRNKPESVNASAPATGSADLEMHRQGRTS